MRLVLIGFAVVLGVVAALAALPWLAEPAVRAGLRLAAPEVRFERLRFGWGDLEVEGIALGADQAARRLRVAWRLPDLLAGGLARVEVEGLAVRAAWRDGGLHLAGIEPADAPGAARLPLPDIGQLVLRGARLELGTPLGTLQLPLSAEVRAIGERLAFEATFGEAHLAGIEAISASGSLEGDLPRDDPLALEHVRVQGKFAVVAEQATLGPAQGIDGAARLDWSYAAGKLSVQASEPGTLAIERLTAADLRAGSLQARFAPAADPLLELALSDGQPATWRAHAAAVVDAFEADLAAPAPLQLRSEAGTITLAADGAGASLAQARIALAGGQLRLPEHALALDGIAAQATLSAAGLAPDQPLPISVERISHAGEPAWFAPLTLQAELSPGAAGLAYEGALTRIGGGLVLEVRGSSEPSGAGRATIELAPVAFGPALQPDDLMPIAAGLVRDVTGQLALNGDLTWSPAEVTSVLAILVEQLGLSSGPARLEQINGVVRLDSVWPPTTPPGQQLAIGLLDLGLPLTAGIATFQLQGGPRLEVEQLQWNLAGGTARAEPFSLGSPLEALDATLRAERLDLGQLLALTRLDGLSGEGSLDGVLPLRISEGAAIIAGGKLAATGPGVLRYDAEAAPAALRAGGEGVDLLLQALENFHYEALEITLDGRTDAAMDIALHIAGANPDLYDGHPVEFNLDLEGELANILRQGIASWQIPARIRERMQGFGR
jgi:Dicarboxylate transport